MREIAIQYKDMSCKHAELPLGLYIHIPFCQTKCTYCDFASQPVRPALLRPYLEAVCAEFRRIARGSAIRTLYVGGGTPTILPPKLLLELLQTVHHVCDTSGLTEITVEANPGTLDMARLEVLRQVGVTRLSLGIQSFDDDELRLLGRIHTATQAKAAFLAARSALEATLNLDLIFGLPRQTLARWAATLEQALALRPEHLSLYALSVEPGTPLACWITTGQVPAPDPDLAADMYELAQTSLEAAGYRHYEISNWALRSPDRDHRCQHNLIYWRNEPYLGLGAAAHSWHEGWRWHNVVDPENYISRLAAGQNPIEEREYIGLGSALEMGETMMMGLRLVEEGVSYERFRARFGRELVEVYERELKELEKLGLLELNGERVRLTARGRLLGNQVFGRFLPG